MAERTPREVPILLTTDTERSQYLTTYLQGIITVKMTARDELARKQQEYESFRNDSSWKRFHRKIGNFFTVEFADRLAEISQIDQDIASLGNVLEELDAGNVDVGINFLADRLRRNIAIINQYRTASNDYPIRVFGGSQFEEALHIYEKDLPVLQVVAPEKAQEIEEIPLAPPRFM